MHKIALEPKELCKLWADGSGAGVEEVNLEHLNYTYARLNSVFPYGAISQPVGES
jgi:hypothetical protein